MVADTHTATLRARLAMARLAVLILAMGANLITATLIGLALYVVCFLMEVGGFQVVAIISLTLSGSLGWSLDTRRIRARLRQTNGKAETEPKEPKPKAYRATMPTRFDNN